MGSADFYPEERPVHEVAVDGFWMDDHPVTVAEFRRFVKATGHVTLAEQAARGGRLPRCRPGAAGPGLARVPPDARPGRPRRLRELVELGAGRRSGGIPKGPGSTLDGRERHPVTHVAYGDAARLRRVGRQGAARPRRSGSSPRGAGSTAPTYAWGDEFAPDGPADGEHLAGRVPVAEPAARPATSGRRRSGRSRPTATACTTSPATSGSGRPTSTRRAPRRGRSTRAAARAGRGATRG